MCVILHWVWNFAQSVQVYTKCVILYKACHFTHSLQFYTQWFIIRTVHYHVQGIWVHVSLHLFVRANDTFTFICFLFKKKSERSHLLAIQFNLSCWMTWLFCKYSVSFDIFELWTFWPLVKSHFRTLELFLYFI